MPRSGSLGDGEWCASVPDGPYRGPGINMGGILWVTFIGRVSNPSY